MPKIQRLDANGNLFVQGSFDEISGTRIREFANGDLFAKEFDEIATELDSSNTIRRIMADGSILIKGFFDEVTKLEAAGGGGVGDTNLLFNYSGGTATGTTYAAFDFGSDGTITGVTSSSNGTWYNGTPTGANFEIQVRLDSATTSGGSTIATFFESDTLSTPGSLSQWYTLNVLRTMYINVGGIPYTRTNVNTVFIREISNPTNIISQSFTLQLN